MRIYMLIDDLYEQLKNMEPDIQTITSFWTNAQLENKFQELENLSQQEDFWKNPQQTEISKELQHTRILRDQYLHIIVSHKDLTELINLFADNESELIKVAPEIN